MASKCGVDVMQQMDALVRSRCTLGKVIGAVQKDLSSRVVYAASGTILYKGYHLYFDNFFSSPMLAQNLVERETFSIATARTNRKHFPANLTTQGRSLSRGQHVSSQVLDGKVQCFVWKDKNSVAFINTISNPDSITTVARKNSDGSRTDVPCPSSVKLYNMNMGGVDLADQKRKAYSCTRKSTKWYMRLFWYLVDIAIVNGHILQLESGNYRKLSQKDFQCRKQSQKDLRLELASHLISCHSSRRKRGRPSDASPVLNGTFQLNLQQHVNVKFVALPTSVNVLSMVVHHALQTEFICALYLALVCIIHPLELFSLSLSFFTHFLHVHVFLDKKSLVITCN